MDEYGLYLFKIELCIKVPSLYNKVIINLSQRFLNLKGGNLVTTLEMLVNHGNIAAIFTEAFPGSCNLF